MFTKAENIFQNGVVVNYSIRLSKQFWSNTYKLIIPSEHIRAVSRAWIEIQIQMDFVRNEMHLSLFKLKNPKLVHCQFEYELKILFLPHFRIKHWQFWEPINFKEAQLDRWNNKGVGDWKWSGENCMESSKEFKLDLFFSFFFLFQFLFFVTISCQFGM